MWACYNTITTVSLKPASAMPKDLVLHVSKPVENVRIDLLHQNRKEFSIASSSENWTRFRILTTSSTSFFKPSNLDRNRKLWQYSSDFGKEGIVNPFCATSTSVTSYFSFT